MTTNPPDDSANARRSSFYSGARSRPTPRSLAVRIDQAAVAVLKVIPFKPAVILFGGLIAALVMPWRVCVLWVAGGLAAEAWAWFATRDAAGAAPSNRQRVHFLVTFLVVNLWWLLLGIAFWRVGTPVAQACGAILFLAVGSAFVLLFYSTPMTFVLAGATPAIAALVVMSLAKGFEVMELVPIGLGLVLTGIFAVGNALNTPSAQQVLHRLDESRNDYRVLADNISDIIVRTDLAGVRQYVSPASLAVLGYLPEEMAGRSRRELIHPDDWEVVAAGSERLISGEDRTASITARVRRSDGEWVWLQTSARLLVENGRPVGFIDVSRDVSHLVLAEAHLRTAMLAAEDANLAKTEFLANVSHEIRTPMNGILGALHLLDGEPISAEGRELMRQAKDCGLMLSNLLNDVLDYSKIEARQMDLAPEPMDVGDALQAVITLLTPEAEAKGLALRAEIAAEDPWIEADPVRMRQAMFNLIGNAVKFTQEGHVSVRLAVTEVSAGRRRMRLEVEDSGIGMNAEAQSHVFDRFRQAESDTARRFGGSGLGLTITRSIAWLMGGEIGFSSVQGKGSTFWFDLQAPAARPAEAEPVADGMLAGLSVLLVEDNVTNRLVARTILTRLGARVQEAEDGLIGLAAARDGAFDLILMDVQMPNMDGIQATRAIRGLVGPAGDTPIIGLTANVMTHQQAEYFAAGMDGVVAKPIVPGHLIGEIVRLLSETDEPLAAKA